MIEIKKVDAASGAEAWAFTGMWLELEKEEWAGRPPFPKLGAPGKLDTTVREWAKDPTHLVLLAWREDAPVGILHASLRLQPHLIPSLALWFDTIYVDPTARKTEAARELIKALKNWAESINISTGQDILQSAQWMAVPTNEQIKRYIRKGATPFGILFAQRLEDNKL